MTTPTRVSQIEAYQSKWLKSADLQGRAHRLKIQRATAEDVRGEDGQTETKIVIDFVSARKRMICNRTQAGALTEIAGTDEFAKWAGLTVILEPGRTRNHQETIAITALPAAASEPPSAGSATEEQT